MPTNELPQPLMGYPYGFFPPSYHPSHSWFLPNQLPPPNLISGLPPLPNPVPAKTEVPRIGPWLEYCDMHHDSQGEDFSKHADKFDKEGYHHINQLVRDRMSEEKLSNWLNIGKGTANLLIQYATGGYGAGEHLEGFQWLAD
ncbi:hypothetical protein F5148DRAFT_1288909 [Russula earlei]|uniref:Uncharacterized protein n=1 Tax=Russula earlei TaxID=71964 RepID=A0ACC0U005_9AGAM|nr:hypothetical protein F5148DRAFT_1288909 [Russula earlei]